MNMFSEMIGAYGTKILNPKEIVKMDTITLAHKNPLVIYHGNCADGFSAAWCFFDWGRKNGTELDFHPGVYNEPPPDVTDRIVYLVDFSYKRTVVEEMLTKAVHIYLIDHHKTALEDLEFLKAPNFTKYCDLERSGAMLAWDFLHNTEYYGPKPNNYRLTRRGEGGYIEPPILLDHVQDRDLWKFKLDGTRQINAAMFSYDYTFENWDKLMSNDPASFMTKHDLWQAGEAIERKHFKDIKELLNVCQRLLPIGPYVVPVASLPYTFSSDAGHIMAKAYKDGTEFAACYWDTPSHRIFSLRSCDNGIDVSAVASGYGGGGHKHAAGFRVPRDHILAIS